MFLTCLVLVVKEGMKLGLIFIQNTKNRLKVSGSVIYSLQLIMCVPCSSVSFCLFESLTSPPPPELCSDEHLCCCGWLPPVCDIYSNFLLPAQHRSYDVRFYSFLWRNSCWLSLGTFFKADTSSLRPSQFLEDSSAEALCFSICALWMLTVFCSFAPSSSSSLILALSLSFKSSCNNRQCVLWY